MLATDGLFDNMPEQEVLDLLAACGPGAQVEELARRLAHRAQELWGDIGRYREIWGDIGRHREI